MSVFKVKSPDNWLKWLLPPLIMGSGILIYLNFNRPAPVKAFVPADSSYTLIQSTPQSAPSAKPDVKAAATTPALNCAPDTGYQSAGALSFNSRTGLIQVNDEPYIHPMYGNTAAELSDLSLKCPLVLADDQESYVNAYTSYWLGWQFSYGPGDNGLCRATDAAVLLHTKQALPDWHGKDLALSKQWGRYLAAVTAHENGHLQLDKSYASSLLFQIQNFPPQDCSTIDQSVNSMANDLIAQLKAANQNYDNSTQHGALQGAIVP
jgi:predicted secreted Zn-dependent protease